MLNPNPLSVLYAMSSVDLRNLWKSQVQVWVACGAAKVNTINHDVDERAREREREIFSIYIYISYIYIYFNPAQQSALHFHAQPCC